MVATDFKLRYQASILGYLWSLLKPLALFTVLYVVFVKLINFGAIPHYAVYLLFGIVIWQFFGEATNGGVLSLVQKAELLRKISFPRYVIVVSVSVSALITFGLNMIVIALFVVLTRIQLSLDVLWLPVLLVELATLAVSFAFFLSALYVSYRDMSYIWEVALQAGFYATPIIYPLSIVHSRYAKYLLFNPLAQIIQDARYVLVSHQTETMTQAFGTPWARAIPVGITIALACTSILFFRRRAPSFAEEA
jgi:ABC-2 type transport system permease protein